MILTEEHILLSILLGILIGVITGVVMIKLLVMIVNTKNYLSSKALIVEILAIPTYWFGQQWLGAQLLKAIKLNEEVYIVSLAITFLVVIANPLTRYIIRMSNEIGKDEDGSNE